MARGRKPSEKELANLRDRSAPDKPGETVAVGVRLTPEQRDWLRAQPEGASFHIRQALRSYIAAHGGGEDE